MPDLSEEERAQRFERRWAQIEAAKKRLPNGGHETFPCDAGCGGMIEISVTPGPVQHSAGRCDRCWVRWVE